MQLGKFIPPSLQPQRRLAIMQACIIGLASGLSAYLLSFGVGQLGAWRVHESYIHSAKIVLPLIGFVGGLIAGWLVEKFGPETSGSGIPQIKAIIGGVTLPLNMRTALVKLVGGIVALGSGLTLGREGPTVQIGAALGKELSDLMPNTHSQKRQLIAAGAAAGLAAAFHAPIAGALFAIEELLKDVSSLTLGTAVLACFIASVLSQMLGAHSLDLHLSQSQISTSFSLYEIPAFIFLGIACGLFGALFNQGILECLKINQSLKWLPLTLRVGIAGLLTGLLLSYLPDQFWNYAALRDMITQGTASGDIAVTAFCSQFILTILAYGSGAPGGLFAPSLVLGASLGYLTGFYNHLFFGIGSTSVYALAGMGAFFAAVARVPMTAIVIVLEMTANTDIALPLMVSTIVAYLVGEKVKEGSIYDRLVVFLGIEPKSKPSSESADESA
jgi:CIC family chloride channel protein